MSIANIPQVSDADLLGEIITWDTESSQVPYQQIRSGLVAAGLNPDVARSLEAASAFARAAKHLKDNRSIDRVDSSTDGKKIAFQLTHKEIKEQANGKVMDHQYECRMVLDTNTGLISCLERPQLAQKAQLLFNEAVENRTSSDVSRIIQKLFKEQADLHSINRKKGVAYFVPVEHRAFTDKVEKFLNSVHGVIDRFPVPKGTERGNASVKRAVSGTIQSLIAELDECIVEWDEKTRPTTMKNAISRLRHVEHKISCCQQYLLEETSLLKDRLEQTKRQLFDKATDIRSTKESKSAEVQESDLISA